MLLQLFTFSAPSRWLTTNASLSDLGADSTRIAWAFLSQVSNDLALAQIHPLTLCSYTVLLVLGELTAARSGSKPQLICLFFQNKDPSRLHCFYTKRSTLIHSTEGDDVAPCYGQQVRSLPTASESEADSPLAARRRSTPRS
jgi:hypothetical protein